ncbi:MAG: NfeD family protein [Pseudanabaenaceae cyanobacterium bins.39]|nr:NfeD family protein [Pseudanabaenaceae cyanobacterium bins.39]
MNLLPTQIWLIIGVALCVIELLVPLPTFLIAGAMGIAALIVAAIALLLPIPALQIVAWMVVSAALVMLSRRFIPKDSLKLQDSNEGITISEIPAGSSGRVKHEGVSWRAMCDDEHLSIPANQKVIILRRQGTTLIVVPENWLSNRL